MTSTQAAGERARPSRDLASGRSEPPKVRTFRRRRSHPGSLAARRRPLVRVPGRARAAGRSVHADSRDTQAAQDRKNTMPGTGMLCERGMVPSPRVHDSNCRVTNGDDIEQGWTGWAGLTNGQNHVHPALPCLRSVAVSFPQSRTAAASGRARRIDRIGVPCANHAHPVNPC